MASLVDYLPPSWVQRLDAEAARQRARERYENDERELRQHQADVQRVEAERQRDEAIRRMAMLGAQSVRGPNMAGAGNALPMDAEALALLGMRLQGGLVRQFSPAPPPEPKKFEPPAILPGKLTRTFLED